MAVQYAGKKCWRCNAREKTPKPLNDWYWCCTWLAKETTCLIWLVKTRCMKFVLTNQRAQLTSKHSKIADLPQPTTRSRYFIPFPPHSLSLSFVITVEFILPLMPSSFHFLLIQSDILFNLVLKSHTVFHIFVKKRFHIIKWLKIELEKFYFGGKSNAVACPGRLASDWKT